MRIHRTQPAVPVATRFLSARLLFLCTVSGGDTVRHLVEDLDVAGVLAARLHEYAVPSMDPASIAFDASAKAEADILVEYLKIVFNLSLFYPRLAKDKEKDKEDPAAAAAAVASSPNKRDNKMLSPDINKPDGSSSSSSAMSASRSRSPSPSPSPSNGRPSSPSSQPQPQASAGVQQRTRQKSSRSDKIKGLFSRSSTNTNTNTTANASKPVERERETIREATGSGSGKSAVWEDEADVLEPWGFERCVCNLRTCPAYESSAD